MCQFVGGCLCCCVRACISLQFFKIIEVPVKRFDPDFLIPNDFAAVMQTEGFEHLKVICPSILTELLEYVAKVGEYSINTGIHMFETFDGSDINGRRVKPRLI